MGTTFTFIGIGLPELIFLLVLLGAPAAIWLWATVDLLSSKFSNRVDKLIWLVAIALIPVLGALLYLIIGRRQKLKNSAL
ncbi:PLDc_N domain-containing protein [Rufibacter immobilis]|uniref:PLDc_N domain-containing protein n=1 Tax=Rufibacter immobilis TaxID=1348778 RepID=A0A3M9N3P3_9BACT|nr:PLD nuclease N-terminal domain-containing protein [Rufibacter immobilis]RNI32356.1 PLDc_N domain-containing protein [Rufibacter immobilis]